mmetsp:Transcript_59251/g.176063  ORF Transcript_59251/g.176063 Transcript_59251/m.176063 type:complete len:104 (-) Transcript_59251:1954-2265(-)
MKTSIPKRVNIYTQIFSDPIVTVSGLVGQAVYIIQGNGKPTKMSKILLPIELDTAMSPSPILATITLESRSGTDVPAARSVIPIITGGIPIVFPIISAQVTMK